MFAPLFAALAAAALFYLLVPVAGAFVVRSSWRRFRASMVASLRVPYLDYAALASAPDGAVFKTFGGIEAVEGRNIVWIRARGGKGRLSVPVDMGRSRFYSLTAGKAPADSADAFYPAEDGVAELSGYDAAEEFPEPLSWRDLPALAEGSSVFVKGRILREGGRTFLGGTRGDPALVVLYGCPERELLTRCVRQGRQPNEYWNRLTPISFALGVASMVAILLAFARGVFVEDIFVMTAIVAFLPLSPLLPPGLVLYFIFRSAWKRGRSLRASRDSVMVPCAAFPPGESETLLPGGERYARRHCDRLDPASPPPGMRFRGMDELAAIAAEARGYTCFGVPGPEPGSPLTRPEDPMAEFVAVPGLPEEFSRRCSRMAHAYTLLAGLALVGAALIDSVLAFIIFRALL